jgi:hypothetical protein
MRLPTMAEKKKYDSTVARIAGNLLSGQPDLIHVGYSEDALRAMAENAVRLARAIVAEVERTDKA